MFVSISFVSTRLSFSDLSLSLSHSQVAQIFSLIDGSRMVADGRWIAPCNSAQTMSFSFGWVDLCSFLRRVVSDLFFLESRRGRDYVLQPSDWLMGRVSSVPSECFAWPVALVSRIVSSGLREESSLTDSRPRS